VTISPESGAAPADAEVSDLLGGADWKAEHDAGGPCRSGWTGAGRYRGRIGYFGPEHVATDGANLAMTKLD
jgi:hypothetical protein